MTVIRVSRNLGYKNYEGYSECSRSKPFWAPNVYRLHLSPQLLAIIPLLFIEFQKLRHQL